MIIQFIGLKKLNEDEISILNRISNKEKGKIDREIKNSKVILSIKKDDKDGKRSRYSIEAKINAPNTKFAAQSQEWDLAKATHKVFNKLEQEINHKLRDN